MMRRMVWTKYLVIFTALIGCLCFGHDVEAAARTWDGGGSDGTCGGGVGDGNKWSCAANWSTDTVPVSGDTVTFDATSTKDANWDTSGPAQITSLTVTSAYSGAFSITKSSVTVAGSWSWAGTGSFSAGTSEIIFTSTGTWTPGSASYYNIKTNQSGSVTLTISGTATVTNNLSLAGTNNAMVFSGGTINVAGNVSCTAGTAGYCGDISSTTSVVMNGTGSQTLSSNSSGAGYIPPLTINKSSGTLTLSGTIYALNWTYTAGTVDPGTSTVLWDMNSTINSGSMQFYNVTFGVRNNTLTLSSNMYVNNNFAFVQSSGFLTVNTSSVYISGNISSNASSLTTSSTGGIVVAGTGAQTMSGGLYDNVTINKPSGTLTLTGTVQVSGDWTYTKGTINPGSSTIQFQTAASTFTPGSASYNNVTVNLNSGFTLTVSGTATILGNLTLNTSSSQAIGTGTLRVFGNVDAAGSAGTSGTGIIEIAGSGAQTLSSTGGGAFPSITVNKSGGILTMSTSISLSNAASWTWTAGELNAGTTTLTLGGTSSTSFTPGTVRYYNFTVSCSSGSNLTISGTATVTNNLSVPITSGCNMNTGTINVSGNVTHSGTAALDGTAVIALVGTGDQSLTFSSTGVLSRITVNKPGGTLSLSGTVSVRNNWTWTAGKLNAGSSTLKLFAASNTVTPGNVTYYNVTVDQNGGGLTLSLAGNLTLSNTFTLDSTSFSGFSTANYSLTTGNLVFTTGTFTAGSSNIKVSGNISGTGTFTAGTSTVILNGTNQTISGTRTYYNLYKLLPDATTDTLTFTHTTTYTIASGGTARFMGTRGYPLSIQSSSAGTAFTLTKTGNVIAEYVSLKDCTVSTATSAVASTNVSGNTNWTFTKEFVSTIRATGGDYTTLSGWEAALGTVDLTAAATKVFSHGGITGSIADNSAVTGATSGATGTVVHATSTQILIKSITGTFQSSEQIRVDVSNYVTSSDAGNGAIAVAEAYNDWPNALNDSVTISGETTDADNFILVTVPATQQHKGKLKDTASSYYRGFTLKPSSSTAIVLDNQVSYTRIEGVAVDGTNATATNIRLNGTSPLGMRLISAAGVDGFSLSGGALVLNSLAYDGTGKCFEDTTSATTNYTVYNSTARGCAHGFHGNNTTTAITLKNCLASSNSTADYALTNTGSKSVTYSASSDATADDFGTTTGDRVSQTFSFIDATNKDFHLAPKDAGARNYGLDLISDSTYPVTKDIDNDTRPANNPNDSSEVSYDMGMDEADYAIDRSKDGIRLKDGVRLK